MKRGNKIIFVLATAALSVLVGCNNDPKAISSVGPSSESTVSTTTSNTVSTTSSGTTSSDPTSIVSSSTSESSSISSVISESSSVHTHVYGAWTLTVEPTEETGGKAERVCEADGEKEVVDVPNLLDTSVWSVEVIEPTHVSEGKKIYTSEYGKVEVKIPALSHTYGEWKITVEPTEKTGGKAGRVCSQDDGGIETVDLPTLLDESVWELIVDIDATHVKDGKRVYSSEYGDVVVNIPALGHTYGEWTIVEKPTESSEGKAVRKCTDDEATEEVILPTLLDDTFWTLEEVLPTHSLDGVKKYTSEYGVVEITLPATGHTVSDYKVVDNGDGTISLAMVCEDDGEVFNVVKTDTKVVGAEYDVDLTASNTWTRDASDSNKFTSTSVTSGGSYMTVTATTDGKFVFSYDISSESNYDYLEVKAAGNTITSGKTVSGTKTGKYELDLKTGDKVIFAYIKDSGADKGRDNVIVTFEPSIIKYNAVTYVSNGGSECEPSFVMNGTILGTLPEPTKDGWYFEGWYVDEALLTKYDGEALTTDTKLYAKWSEAQKVTFVTYEGDTVGIDEVVFQIGKAPAMPKDDPVREGYYFLGWYKDPGFKTEYDATKEANASFTLYAKWIAVEDANPFYGEYKGFYIKDDGTLNSSYAEFSVDTEGNYSLRTNWSAYIKGTVNLEGNEITFTNETGDSGEVYGIINDDNVLYIRAKEGSTFRTYVLAKNLPESTTGVKAASLDVTNDTNSSKMVFVSFNNNGTNVNKVFVCGVSSGKETTFTCSSFNGVRNVSDESVELSSSLKNELVINIKINGNDYFLYKSKNGYVTTSDGFAGKYTSETEGTLILSGAGYTLNKYSASTTAREYVVIDEVKVFYEYDGRYFILNKENMTFTSENKMIKVTFDFGYELNDEKVISESQWKYNEWNDIPQDPTREGYTFDGWYDSNDKKITGRVRCTDDTTYYARWALNHTVKFVNVDDTETVFASVQVGEGKTVTVISDPVAPDGYYFDGWYADKDCSEAFDSKTAIMSDTTIYGRFLKSVDYAGTYVGFNLYESKQNVEQSTNSSYDTTIFGSGLGTTGKVQGLKVESITGIKVTFSKGGEKYYGAIANDDDGHYVLSTHYSGASTNGDFVRDDMAFLVRKGENNISFVYTSISDKEWIVKVIDGDSSYLVYVNANTNEIFVGVTLSDSKGSSLDFLDVYKNDAYAVELVISKGETKVKNYRLVNGVYSISDGYDGVYETTIDETACIVTLDGYGSAKVKIGDDVIEYSYAVTWEVDSITLTLTAKDQLTLSFSMDTEAKTLVRLTDGLEGEYVIGTSDDKLILDGFGKATIDTMDGAVEGTYDVDGTKVIVKIGENSTVYVLDKTNKIARVYIKSIFSDYKFSRTGEYGTLKFDETEENKVSGVIKFVNDTESYKGTFTGEYDAAEGVLTIKLHSDLSYVSEKIEDKVVKLKVEDGQLVCVESTATETTYFINVDDTFTCSDFKLDNN